MISLYVEEITAQCGSADLLCCDIRSTYVRVKTDRRDTIAFVYVGSRQKLMTFFYCKRL